MTKMTSKELRQSFSPNKYRTEVFSNNVPYHYTVTDKENNKEYVLERFITSDKTIDKVKISRTVLGVLDLAKQKRKIAMDLITLDDLFPDEDTDTDTSNSSDIDTDTDIETEYENKDDNRVADIKDSKESIQYTTKYIGNYNKDFYYADYQILYDSKIVYTNKRNSIKENSVVANSISLFSPDLDVEKYEAGDPKDVEEITTIINLLSNYDLETASQVYDDFEFISNKNFGVRKYINADGKYTQVTNNKNKIVFEEFDNNKYKIELYRFSSAQSNPLHPKGFFMFKGSTFDIDYSIYKINNITSNELKVMEHNFSNRSIYLPKTQVYTEVYGLNLHYIKECDYQIIDTEQKLRDAIEDLKKTVGDDGVVCYDAETTGLKFRRFVENKDSLCCHSLSWKDKQAIIIPVRMKYLQNIKPEIANEYLKTVLEVNPMLAHNGAADVRFLQYDNIDLNLQEDTMHLIKHVMPFITQYPEVGFGRYLDDLVVRMFGYDMIDMQKYVYKPSNATFDFSIVNKDYMIYYGCPDTDLCRRLWKVLRQKLNPQQYIPYKNTVRFSKDIALSASFSGLGINVNAINKEKERATLLTERLRDIIYKLTGEDRNTLSLTSSVQKTNYIFGKMGAPLDYARKTDTGKLSADKIVVDRLGKIKTEYTPTFKEDILDVDGQPLVQAEELNILKYPFCRLVRIFDDLNSNIKNHYNRLINQSENNIYHPDFQVGKADTWRTLDGIQTMKNTLKGEVGAPNNSVTQRNNEEWYWSTTDYRTQEVCLAANQSEDWAMIDLLCDVEADSHTMTASDLFEVPPYLVTKYQRTGAKTCNFGLTYGMKEYTLGQRIFGVDVLSDEQLASAKQLHSLYSYKKAEMLKPLVMAKAFVTENGYLVNKLGYKMVYPKIIDKVKYIEDVFNTGDLSDNIQPKVDPIKRSTNLRSLLNASGNYPIQSWAAGILMEVYTALIKKIKDDGYENDIYIPLTVHDEVGTCFRKDKVHPYYIIHSQLQTLVTKLEYLNKEKVAPLYIGIGFGENWVKAKDDLAEIPIKLQYILEEEFLNGTCPTREEILEEGIYEHFRRRIKDYIRQRCINLFPEMYTNKHFVKSIIEDTLYKKEMYVGKQMNENFKIFISANEIDMDKFIRALYDRQPTDSIDDITYEDGEPIKDEVEHTTEQKNVEFYFIEGQIHSRISVKEDYLQINLSNLNPLVTNNIKLYIESLTNKEYNIHNKKIIYIEPNGKINKTDLNILAIPMNFTDVFNNILNGATPSSISNTDISKLLDENGEDLIRYSGNTLIISSRYIEKIKEINQATKVEMILSKYTSASTIARIPIILEDYKTGIQKDTGLKMINVNFTVVEDLLSILK